MILHQNKLVRNLYFERGSKMLGSGSGDAFLRFLQDAQQTADENRQNLEHHLFETSERNIDSAIVILEKFEECCIKQKEEVAENLQKLAIKLEQVPDREARIQEAREAFEKSSELYIDSQRQICEAQMDLMLPKDCPRTLEELREYQSKREERRQARARERLQETQAKQENEPLYSHDHETTRVPSYQRDFEIQRELPQRAQPFTFYRNSAFAAIGSSMLLMGLLFVASALSASMVFIMGAATLGATFGLFKWRESIFSSRALAIQNEELLQDQVGDPYQIGQECANDWGAYFRSFGNPQLWQWTAYQNFGAGFHQAINAEAEEIEHVNRNRMHSV